MINNQRGYTLVELIVSMTLLALLMNLVLLYLQNIELHVNRVLKQSDELSDLLILKHHLATRITSAGFSPCIQLSHGLKVEADGQRVIMHRMDHHFSKLMLTDEIWKRLSWPINLKKGDRVILADCRQFEVHEIEGVKKQGRQMWLKLEGDVLRRLVSPVYVGLWHEESFEFYPQKGLYYHHNNDRKQRLSSWIKGFKIRPLGPYQVDIEMHYQTLGRLNFKIEKRRDV